MIELDEEGKTLYAKYKWYERADGYLYRPNNDSTVLFHRELLGYPDGIVDHIDQNPRNNRKDNLRVVNRSVNALNAKKRNNRNGASKFKGVSRAPRGYKAKPWRARIFTDGVERSLGYFATEQEAADAYNRANPLSVSSREDA